jgi:hypothetical protein
MSSSQRRKGHDFERKIASQLRAVMPGCEIKRGLQSRGGEVPDVDCPVFWVECKHGKKMSVRAALEQAERDSKGTHKVPLAVVKDDRKPAMAVMRFDELLAFIEQWWGLSQR